MTTNRQTYVDCLAPTSVSPEDIARTLSDPQLTCAWEWAEPKADGVWCRVELTSEGVTAYGRNGKVLFERSEASEGREPWGAIAPATMIGEYIDGSGWTKAHARDVGMVIGFDCVRFAGRDVSDHPRWRRRELMIVACDTSPRHFKPIVGEYIDPKIPDVLCKVWRGWVEWGGWEGIVLKSAGPYRVSVMRIKARHDVDYVCTGFEMGEGRKIKSVIGSMFINGELVECVRAAGLSDFEKREIYRERKARTGQVFRVLAHAVSEKGTARHPVFNGWHADKPAAECVL